MEKYVLYTVKNILQFKKSQINAKLDRNLRNAVKKYAIEANLLEDEDINFENKAKDLKVKNEDDIDMSTTNSYLHTITIIHKYWKEQNTIDYLESFVLFHLYYFLRVTDNVSMTNHGICIFSTITFVFSVSTWLIKICSKYLYLPNKNEVQMNGQYYF